MENNNNFEANLPGNSPTPPTQVPRPSPRPAQNPFGSSSVSVFNGELKKVFKLSSIIQLNNAVDFATWKRQILTYLKLHSLNHLIEQKYQSEADNAVVLSVLLQTVSPKLQKIIQHSHTAFEAFNILITEIKGSVDQQIVDLFRQLTHLNYNSVDDYVTKFKLQLLSCWH